MFFDSHCHIDFPCFDSSRARLIEQCKQVGIVQFLLPSVKIETISNLLQYVNQKDNVYVAAGLHPYFISEHSEKDVTQLTSFLSEHSQNEKLVAIGECGLDFSLAAETFALQETLFIAQIKLAKQYDLPLILHHRKSMNRMISLLKQYGFQSGGILHAFSGSAQQGMAFVDLGFCLGVGGTITYPRANKTKAALKALPLSALVLETDSPDMPIMGKQGEINTPLSLLPIYEALCELRSESKIQIKQACYANTLRILHIN